MIKKEYKSEIIIFRWYLKYKNKNYNCNNQNNLLEIINLIITNMKLLVNNKIINY
jgi:hypothetical protein